MTGFELGGGRGGTGFGTGTGIGIGTREGVIEPTGDRSE